VLNFLLVAQVFGPGPEIVFLLAGVAILLFGQGLVLGIGWLVAWFIARDLARDNRRPTPPPQQPWRQNSIRIENTRRYARFAKGTLTAGLVAQAISILMFCSPLIVRGGIVAITKGELSFDDSLPYSATTMTIAIGVALGALFILSIGSIRLASSPATTAVVSDNR
jgi:hypothetical protein